MINLGVWPGEGGKGDRLVGSYSVLVSKRKKKWRGLGVYVKGGKGRLGCGRREWVMG